ncbi:MAG: porin [Xanthobacteraceae bacterium]
MNWLSVHTQLLLRGIALTAAVTVSAAFIAPCVMAQTLTQPNGPIKPSPPPSKKSHATAHEESCSAFGAGFVKVPGTDACVRVGGWVTMEGTSR